MYTATPLQFFPIVIGLLIAILVVLLASFLTQLYARMHLTRMHNAWLQQQQDNVRHNRNMRESINVITSNVESMHERAVEEAKLL